MSVVLPSQAVNIINRLFPFTAKQKVGDSISLDYTCAESLSGIVHLIEQIPPELINMNDTEYIDFTVNVEAIRSAVKSFEHRGNVNPLVALSGFSGLNPVTIVRRTLENCRDEFPSKSVTELLFISDIDLRDSIRMDISTAEQAFRNGAWKASTVLAGSAIEALLLWRLKQEDPENLKDKQDVDIDKLDKMDLGHLIKASKEMETITDETFILAPLAKDFRNLIHPGRSIRLGQICNRGTALTALAALEHVVNDLT